MPGRDIWGTASGSTRTTAFRASAAIRSIRTSSRWPGQLQRSASNTRSANIDLWRQLRPQRSDHNHRRRWPAHRRQRGVHLRQPRRRHPDQRLHFHGDNTVQRPEAEAHVHAVQFTATAASATTGSWAAATSGADCMATMRVLPTRTKSARRTRQPRVRCGPAVGRADLPTGQQRQPRWDLDEMMWDAHGNLDPRRPLATDRPHVVKLYGSYLFNVRDQVGAELLRAERHTAEPVRSARSTAPSLRRGPRRHLGGTGPVDRPIPALARVQASWAPSACASSSTG